MADAQGGKSPAFRAEGLAKVYGTGEAAVHALRGVDLEIGTGELVFILGTSGSGKSTLVNILGGLDRASSGRVRFHDLDLTGASDRALTLYRRNSVGFIFQMYNLMPSLTARENVALVTEIAADAMKPEDALAVVGLQERLDHFPAQMSGGEQQRVAIARAIAKRPEVLLCDEPTGALDSQTGIRVLEAIEKVNVDLSTTVVVISHNAEMAAIGDRTLFMTDGRIVNETRNETRRAPASLAW
ncbi:ABC transporter ATP-binding protein [Afifella sp. IM 167]|uniref:ABC transporter ATP-binding protein n=1 Tax=Afifella sp. IM 167 TaxID=2033586 RepID=UPI001CCC427B|nr:ABC transporter ATP-binding protein [Afifella sp. IM 167]MBZ8134739.1 ABC transporter [Afifella sp. IM 167]